MDHYEQFEKMHELKVHFCQVPQSHPLFWLPFCIFCFNVRTIFSRRRLSLFGTISWLASGRLGHIKHWSLYLCFFSSLSRHTIFSRHTCDSPVSHDTPPIPCVSRNTGWETLAYKIIKQCNCLEEDLHGLDLLKGWKAKTTKCSTAWACERREKQMKTTGAE